MWFILLIIVLIYVYASLPQNTQAGITASVNGLLPFAKKVILSLVDIVKCSASCISSKLFPNMETIQNPQIPNQTVPEQRPLLVAQAK